MLREKLLQTLNDQINYELYSAHVYVAIQAYCDSLDLPGFKNFFKVQEQEERFHASKFYDFVNQTDGRINITALPQPKNDFASILAAFETALEHERGNTSRIYRLADMAQEEKDHATMSLLKWFIDEQVEEEATITAVIKKLKRIGTDAAALYILDTELAARVFVPPTTPV